MDAQRRQVAGTGTGTGMTTMTKIARSGGGGRMRQRCRCATLTGGGEEDRDKDNCARRWRREDATSASTGGGEEDKDDNFDDHCARWWRGRMRHRCQCQQAAGTMTTTTTTTIAQGVGGGRMCSGGSRRDLTTMSPPHQRWDGGAQRLSVGPIPLLSLSPPIAQEEVNGNDDHLWAIVDKTGRQKTMKEDGTGRKGKGRRGGITLFNRVIDINALDIFDSA